MMNLVDVLLALVIVACAVGGWWRGLVAGAADLLALAGSLVCAFLLYPHAVALAEKHGLQGGVWTAPVAFLIVYGVTRVILGIVLGRLVRAMSPTAHAHPVNRALGLIPGTVSGLVNATIAAMLLLALPLSDEITRSVSESALANRFAGPAEWVEAKLRPIFDPAVEKTLAKLTVQPGSTQSVKLPFTVKNPRPRPDLEAAMLVLVNDERRAQGLRALQADPQATEVARAHAVDMFARGYFSHITPEGENPFGRMRDAHLRFLTAGENLALARTLPMAHRGLMDSPGHRANILHPSFGRLGIGVVDGGRYGLMVTQTFRN
jgi:uncharacterized protein YkwD